MRKVLFLGAFALGAAACEPDIAQDPAPSNPDVVAEFDPAASPPVVPSPNDLAIDRRTGLVNVPINPNSSAAEQEFTRDYLNTLDGFPAAVSASTTVRDLDPTTVNTNTVKVIDLYEGTPLSRPPSYVVAYNEDTDRINVIAPNGWPKGGRYAVVIVGGENGVKTTAGKPVIGSATWAFASSQEPLVTCEDLTAPDCRATTEIIPSTETDPARRLLAQTAAALQLEQLRRGYAPIIDLAAEKFSLKRDDVVLLWTFTVMNQPEATFNPDLSAPTIPFPNDLLRRPGANGQPTRLTLPLPAGSPPEVSSIINGINELDGWSTTAPIISENSPTLGAIDRGSQLDPNTVTLRRLAIASEANNTVLFVKASNPLAVPDVRVCINCASSQRPPNTPGTVPEQLQIVPNVPLDESSQYAVAMLRGMKDVRGRLVAPTTAMALMRLSAPIFVNGKSQVSVLPDQLAGALEPIRAAMKPLFDTLEQQAGIPRKNINLAWVFTTQSTRSKLLELKAEADEVAPEPQYLVELTTELKGAMATNGFDNAAVRSVFVGAFETPHRLNPTTGKLLAPADAGRVERVPFMLFMPNTDMPEGGYPVAVFGHGLTGNRTNVLAVANTLNAAGFAVAAMDTVFHGERASCAGISETNRIAYGDPANPTIIDEPNEACATGSVCDTTPTSATFGRCVAGPTTTAAQCNSSPTAVPHGDLVCGQQNQGRCLSTNRCEGGDFLREDNDPRQPPIISGWNYISVSNLFSTRDNFRHHVVDFTQFARMLGSDGLSSKLAPFNVGTLNRAQVDYVGQSLGGLQGVLSASVSERMRRVALNAAGGGLVDVLLTATNPQFVARRNGFNQLLTSLGRPPGTPGYDEFITLARTILDPGDPRNYGFYLENSSPATPTQPAWAPPAGREAFIQYIRGDDVIPNPVTQQLISAANRGGPRTVQTYMFDLPLPTGVRHAFFAISDPNNRTDPQLKSIRDAAQGQVAGFLSSGLAPTP